VSFLAENLRDWRGHDVIDPSGDKIGTLEAVYVDTSTDSPVFATVQAGLPGRRRLLFVPLVDATVGPGHVRVTCSKKVARKAPSIDPDGELAASEEPAVYAHYDLPYAAGAAGERKLARR
jgi:hypothetical protein